MFIELLAELFFAIFISAPQDSKSPRWLKILVLTVVYFIAILGSIAALIYLHQAGNFIGSITLGIVASALVTLWVFGCYKNIKSKCSQ